MRAVGGGVSRGYLPQCINDWCIVIPIPIALSMWMLGVSVDLWSQRMNQAGISSYFKYVKK